MSSYEVSPKSWLGVMLPGFSALASSTQANWAAPATVEVELLRCTCLTGIGAIV